VPLINTPRYTTTLAKTDPDFYPRIGQMELTMRLVFMDLPPYYQPMVTPAPEGPYFDPITGPSRENTTETGTPTAEDLGILLYNRVVELQEDGGALTVVLSPKLPPAQVDLDFLLDRIGAHWAESYVPLAVSKARPETPWIAPPPTSPTLLVKWPDEPEAGLWRQNKGEEPFARATPLR